MAFDKTQFLTGFKAETREHRQTLSAGLIKMEKSPDDKELLKVLMRTAHTIKGLSTMMGYKRIADIAHKMEDGFEQALEGKVLLKKPHFDVFLKCVDAIDPLLEDKVTWADKGVERPFADELFSEVDAVFSGKMVDGVKPVAPVPLSQKHVAVTVQEDSLRVDVEKLNKLGNLSGELVISKIRLGDIVKNLAHKVDAQSDLPESFHHLIKDLREVSKNIDLLSADVQREVMKVRMVPVAHLFNAFPRAMRDLAIAKEKEVDFQILGEMTQLDKSILDQMKDPLMHLLRNAVDHGLETAADRRVLGKSEGGKIVLSAHQEGSQIVIAVSDDGSGVDVARVKETAVKQGLVARERVNDLTEEQIFQLLFTPGFTTEEEVSETSGRGVGLDVVREAIVKLKGQVEVKSVPGQGTTFVMRLPLTLAITDSLLVDVGADTFIIPIDMVQETVLICNEDIKTVETKEAVTIRGSILPLVRLNDLLGLPRKGISEKKFFPIVIVQSVEKKIAIRVDSLVGRQEIIRKALGDPLKKVRNISGATILGNGRVVLVLDIPSIIGSAEGGIIHAEILRPKAATNVKKKKTILLAEDSLSTAMLEKNVLESVGYSVVLARDGKEALDRSAQEKFDLVISDVLMPRMDGFELTERLKKTNLYKDVPVIIVTTRESDADKRRGMEAGADAYILKKDFTSEGLLETIERLLG
ncbi:MAG: hybrid sensor histidine kinase/response regulator [Candidatus Omnitrophica bacterium]|nr:hybrid sensor histidine kinase/response regulator [Candidatus Omnitrophota bacterium]